MTQKAVSSVRAQHEFYSYINVSLTFRNLYLLKSFTDVIILFGTFAMGLVGLPSVAGQIFALRGALVHK